MLTRTFSLALLSGLLLCAACTDDFTVGNASHDAGADSNGSEDSAAGDAAPTCETLTAELGRARDAITTCTEQDGFCAVLVKDECECDFGIISASGTAPKAYATRVGDYKQAGCATNCKACRPPLQGVGFTCDASQRATPEGHCVDPAAVR